MLFQLIAITTSLIMLTIASINDIKTREVPDFLSYFFIAIAIAIRIIWYIFSKDVSVLLWVPISFAALAGFAYMMYKTGQWGGGDVKIMAGIGILMCSFPGERIPFFANFLLNTLFVGAFYGIAGIAILALKSHKKLKFNIYQKLSLIVSMGLIIAMFYTLPPAVAFLGAIVVISLTSLLFIKKIENKLMERYVPIDKLTEGDWLVNDIKLNGKVYVKKRNIGLTISDIKKLKKAKSKIKKVKIKIGIPFVPSFLISLIITILFGNILLKLLFI
ncbi:MAG: prepilin peptidase [Nanoarchaeota archaeon]|nr:prepilin peptidase [Nanoarchaeota archaeon]